MKNADIRGNVKLLCLKIRKALHSFFSGFFSKLSIIIVLFSAIVSFWLLVPTLFDRVPIFSYSSHRLELPMKFEMYGSVKIVDCKGNLLNDSVAISVGGYRVKIGTNVEYDLVFSCPKDEFFFVTISYIDQKGKERFYTEKVGFPDDSYVFQEDFIIG